MGSRKIDLTGMRFGNLIVLEECGRKRKEVQWKCLCSCGNITYVPGYCLRTEHTTSCGCMKGKKTPKSFRYIHNKDHINRAYTNMKTRCYNPNYYLFKHYGGKGITICDEWIGKDGFENFYKWSMQNGYKPSLSIDRIDNSKGYSPDNCRWVTMKEQQNNRTNNRLITANGETHTMAEWAEISGIPYITIQRRIYSGWEENIAVTKEVQRHASYRDRQCS